MTSRQRRVATDRAESIVRERLIDAASRSIDEHGTGASTSRVIAAAAGENLAAITYYFGSKDNLIAEALTRNARRLMEPVIATLTDAGASPAEKLLRAVQMLHTILAGSHDRLPGYLHSLATATHDAAIAGELRSLHDELIDVLTAEMSTQVDAGSIPSWVHPRAMAQLIVALANGVAVGAAINPEHTDAPAIGEQFARLLLSAAAAEQPRSGE